MRKESIAAQMLVANTVRIATGASFRSHVNSKANKRMRPSEMARAAGTESILMDLEFAVIDYSWNPRMLAGRQKLPFQGTSDEDR
jgi:hypothetical protein